MGHIDMEYHDVIVTTGDLRKEYEVVGPVYFQVSNKGIFSSVIPGARILKIVTITLMAPMMDEIPSK